MQRIVKILSILILVCGSLFAALPASTVWEVRVTNGVDTNGGAFVTGATGTNYSQQNAAQYSGTNLASSNGSTNPCTVTSATHNFVAADVGNIINISAGTSWTLQSFEIVSTSSNAATLDRACGSGASLTSGTFAVGGAKKTIGAMNTILTTAGENASGQTVWIKAEATVTTTVAITLSPNNGGTAGPYATQINGYTSSRGDNGKVTIQASSGSSYTILTFGATGTVIYRNFTIDGNSIGGGRCLGLQGANSFAQNILAKNCTNGAIVFNNSSNTCYQCQATTNTTAAAIQMNSGNGPNWCIDCIAYANTFHGFSITAGLCIRCISANNTGSTTDGFSGSTATTDGIGSVTGSVLLDHCVSYTNGRYGFKFYSNIASPVLFQNSVSWGNTTDDIFVVTNTIPTGGLIGNYNAYKNNVGYPTGPNDVALTADPFVAGASNNFALNSTTGGGAAISSAGFPGVLTIGGTGFAAIGALQPAGTGGQHGSAIIQ